MLFLVYNCRSWKYEQAKKILLLIILTITMSTSDALQADSHKILSRHNLGVSFQFRKEIYVTTATARSVFVVVLPRRFVLAPTNFSCAQIRHAWHRRRIIQEQARKENGTVIENPLRLWPIRNGCHRVETLGRALYNSQVDVLYKFQKFINKLYMMVHILVDHEQNSRTRRAWFPVLGEILGRLTRVATTEDLKSVRETVAKVLEIDYKNLKVWQSANNHFTTAIEIQNSQINNIKKLIEMHRNSIEQVYHTVVEHEVVDDSKFALIAHILKRQSNLGFRLQEVEQLRVAIEQTLTGSLSPTLINPVVLKNTLGQLERNLQVRHTHLHVVYNDLAWYYRSAPHFPFSVKIPWN